MIRFWLATVMAPDGTIWQERKWIVSDPGFNVNAEALPELWAEHLNAVRERVRKSYDFPISDVLPYGYTIELEILEFNGTGVAPID
jgi:hypothetical protein